MTDGPNDTALTAFQLDVAKVFFALPAAEGFLLYGGAALVAQHLTKRPTQDLDFASGDVEAIGPARDQFVAAASSHGWDVRTAQDNGTFCRLLITSPEQLLVDLVLDAPPSRQPTMTVAGPSLDPLELAGQKMLALFGRAAPRDFADVYSLSFTYDRATLIAEAKRIDSGFSDERFVDALRNLVKYSDRDLSFTNDDDVSALRAFFADWIRTLSAAEGPG